MPVAASNPTVAVAGLTTKALSVMFTRGLLLPTNIPISDATISNAPIIDANAHIGDEHAVIADVDAVPAADNNLTTTPYNKIIMPAARRESAGRSVEPSNVNGINEQHEMWIRQCMRDDCGIQYPNEYLIVIDDGRPVDVGRGGVSAMPVLCRFADAGAGVIVIHGR
jgi:hypothetical protein